MAHRLMGTRIASTWALVLMVALACCARLVFGAPNTFVQLYDVTMGYDIPAGEPMPINKPFTATVRAPAMTGSACHLSSGAVLSVRISSPTIGYVNNMPIVVKGASGDAATFYVATYDADSFLMDDIAVTIGCSGGIHCGAITTNDASFFEVSFGAYFKSHPIPGQSHWISATVTAGTCIFQLDGDGSSIFGPALMPGAYFAESATPGKYHLTFYSPINSAQSNMIALTLPDGITCSASPEPLPVFPVAAELSPTLTAAQMSPAPNVMVIPMYYDGGDQRCEPCVVEIACVRDGSVYNSPTARPGSIVISNAPSYNTPLYASADLAFARDPLDIALRQVNTPTVGLAAAPANAFMIMGTLPAGASVLVYKLGIQVPKTMCRAFAVGTPTFVCNGNTATFTVVTSTGSDLGDVIDLGSLALSAPVQCSGVFQFDYSEMATTGPFSPTAVVAVTLYDMFDRTLGSGTFAPRAAPGDLADIAFSAWLPPVRTVPSSLLTMQFSYDGMNLMYPETQLWALHLPLAIAGQSAAGVKHACTNCDFDALPVLLDITDNTAWVRFRFTPGAVCTGATCVRQITIPMLTTSVDYLNGQEVRIYRLNQHDTATGTDAQLVARARAAVFVGGLATITQPRPVASITVSDLTMPFRPATGASVGNVGVTCPVAARRVYMRLVTVGLSSDVEFVDDGSGSVVTELACNVVPTTQTTFQIRMRRKGSGKVNIDDFSGAFYFEAYLDPYNSARVAITVDGAAQREIFAVTPAPIVVVPTALTTTLTVTPSTFQQTVPVATTALATSLISGLDNRHGTFRVRAVFPPNTNVNSRLRTTGMPLAVTMAAPWSACVASGPTFDAPSLTYSFLMTPNCAQTGGFTINVANFAFMPFAGDYPAAGATTITLALDGQFAGSDAWFPITIATATPTTTPADIAPATAAVYTGSRTGGAAGVGEGERASLTTQASVGGAYVANEHNSLLLDLGERFTRYSVPEFTFGGVAVTPTRSGASSLGPHVRYFEFDDGVMGTSNTPRDLNITYSSIETGFAAPTPMSLSFVSRHNIGGAGYVTRDFTATTAPRTTAVISGTFVGEPSMSNPSAFVVSTTFDWVYSVDPRRDSVTVVLTLPNTGSWYLWAPATLSVGGVTLELAQAGPNHVYKGVIDSTTPMGFVRAGDKASIYVDNFPDIPDHSTPFEALVATITVFETAAPAVPLMAGTFPITMPHAIAHEPSVGYCTFTLNGAMTPTTASVSVDFAVKVATAMTSSVTGARYEDAVVAGVEVLLPGDGSLGFGAGAQLTVPSISAQLPGGLNMVYGNVASSAVAGGGSKLSAVMAPGQMLTGRDMSVNVDNIVALTADAFAAEFAEDGKDRPLAALVVRVTYASGAAERHVCTPAVSVQYLLRAPAVTVSSETDAAYIQIDMPDVPLAVDMGNDFAMLSIEVHPDFAFLWQCTLNGGSTVTNSSAVINPGFSRFTFKTSNAGPGYISTASLVCPAGGAHPRHFGEIPVTITFGPALVGVRYKYVVPPVVAIIPPPPTVKPAFELQLTTLSFIADAAETGGPVSPPSTYPLLAGMIDTPKPSVLTSPDGLYVLVVYDKRVVVYTSARSVRSTTIATGELTKLASATMTHAFTAFAFSPDSRHFLFATANAPHVRARAVSNIAGADVAVNTPWGAVPSDDQVTHVLFAPSRPNSETTVYVAYMSGTVEYFVYKPLSAKFLRTRVVSWATPGVKAIVRAGEDVVALCHDGRLYRNTLDTPVDLTRDPYQGLDGEYVNFQMPAASGSGAIERIFGIPSYEFVVAVSSVGDVWYIRSSGVVGVHAKLPTSKPVVAGHASPMHRDVDMATRAEVLLLLEGDQVATVTCLVSEITTKILDASGTNIRAMATSADGVNLYVLLGDTFELHRTFIPGAQHTAATVTVRPTPNYSGWIPADVGVIPGTPYTVALRLALTSAVEADDFVRVNLPKGSMVDTSLAVRLTMYRSNGVALTPTVQCVLDPDVFNLGQAFWDGRSLTCSLYGPYSSYAGFATEASPYVVVNIPSLYFSPVAERATLVMSEDGSQQSAYYMRSDMGLAFFKDVPGGFAVAVARSVPAAEWTVPVLGSVKRAHPSVYITGSKYYEYATFAETVLTMDFSLQSIEFADLAGSLELHIQLPTTMRTSAGSATLTTASPAFSVLGNCANAVFVRYDLDGATQRSTLVLSVPSNNGAMFWGVMSCSIQFSQFGFAAYPVPAEQFTIVAKMSILTAPHNTFAVSTYPAVSKHMDARWQSTPSGASADGASGAQIVLSTLSADERFYYTVNALGRVDMYRVAAGFTSFTHLGSHETGVRDLSLLSATPNHNTIVLASVSSPIVHFFQRYPALPANTEGRPEGYLFYDPAVSTFDVTKGFGNCAERGPRYCEIVALTPLTSNTMDRYGETGFFIAILRSSRLVALADNIDQNLGDLGVSSVSKAFSHFNPAPTTTKLFDSASSLALVAFTEEGGVFTYTVTPEGNVVTQTYAPTELGEFALPAGVVGAAKAGAFPGDVVGEAIDETTFWVLLGDGRIALMFARDIIPGLTDIPILTYTAPPPLEEGEYVTALAATPVGSSFFVSTSLGKIHRYVIENAVPKRIEDDGLAVPAAIAGNRIVAMEVSATGSHLLVSLERRAYALKLVERLALPTPLMVTMSNIPSYGWVDNAFREMRIDSPAAGNLVHPIPAAMLATVTKLRLTFPLIFAGLTITKPTFTVGGVACTVTSTTGVVVLCSLASAVTLATGVYPALAGLHVLAPESVVPMDFGISFEWLTAADAVVFAQSAATVHGGAGVVTLLSVPPTAELRTLEAGIQRLQVKLYPALTAEDDLLLPYIVMLRTNDACPADDAFYDPATGMPVVAANRAGCCSFSTNPEGPFWRGGNVDLNAFSGGVGDIWVYCGLSDSPVTIRLMINAPTYKNPLPMQRRYEESTIVLDTKARFVFALTDESGGLVTTGAVLIADKDYFFTIEHEVGGPSASPITLALAADARCRFCETETSSEACGSWGGSSTNVVVASMAMAPANTWRFRCPSTGTMSDITMTSPHASPRAISIKPIHSELLLVTTDNRYVLAGSGATRIRVNFGVVPSNPVTLIFTPSAVRPDGDDFCRVRYGTNVLLRDEDGVSQFAVVGAGAAGATFTVTCAHMVSDLDMLYYTVADVDGVFVSAKSLQITTKSTAVIADPVEGVAPWLNENVMLIATVPTPLRIETLVAPSRGSMFTATIDTSKLEDPRMCSIGTDPTAFNATTSLRSVDMVVMDESTRSETVYVWCASSTGANSIGLVVSFVVGDLYEFTAEVTPTVFHVKAKGSLRASTDTSPVHVLTTFAASAEAPNPVEDMRTAYENDFTAFATVVPRTSTTGAIDFGVVIDFLPAPTTEFTAIVTINIRERCAFDREATVWADFGVDGTKEIQGEPYNEETVGVRIPAGTASITLPLECVSIVNSETPAFVHVDTKDVFPETVFPIVFETKVDLVLLDLSSIPLTLAVDSPLHTRVYTPSPDPFTVTVEMTSPSDFCLVSNTRDGTYEARIDVKATSYLDESSYVFIKCSAPTVAPSTVVVEVNDGRVIADSVSVTGIGAIGTIYLSTNPTSFSSPIPASVRVAEELSLWVHLVPLPQADYPVQVTLVPPASQSAHCGIVDAADPSQLLTSLLAIVPANSATSAPFRYRCDTIDRNGPSMALTPSTTGYTEFFSSPVVSRGYFSPSQRNGSPLGTTLPLSTMFNLTVDVTPEPVAAIGSRFTVSLTGGSSDCKMRLAGTTAEPTVTSMVFENAAPPFDFDIYCNIPTAAGPRLVIEHTPSGGLPMLFTTWRSSSPMAIKGVINLKVAADNAMTDATFFPRVSQSVPSFFTLDLLPVVPGNTDFKVHLVGAAADAGTCRLNTKTGSAEMDVDAYATSVVVNVPNDARGPTDANIAADSRVMLALLCMSLPGTLAMPHLVVELNDPSTAVLSYATYTSEQRITVAGGASIVNSGDVFPAEIVAGTPTGLRVVLRPAPAQDTVMRVAVTAITEAAGDCVLATQSGTIGTSTARYVDLQFTSGDFVWFMVLCKRVSNPVKNTFEVTWRSGELYQPYTSPQFTATAAGALFYRKTATAVEFEALPAPADAGGLPAAVINTHTATLMALRVPVSPVTSTTFSLTTDPSSKAQNLECWFLPPQQVSNADPDAAFIAAADKPALTSISLTITGAATEAQFYMYCPTPMKLTSAKPYIVATQTAGVVYSNFVSPTLLLRASTCAPIAPSPNVLVTYVKSTDFEIPAWFQDLGADASAYYAHLAVATYACESGYYLVPDVVTTATRTCEAKQWTGVGYTCMPVECGTFTAGANVENVAYTLSPRNTPTTFGAIATVTCKTGYVAGQSGALRPQSQSLTCKLDSSSTQTTTTGVWLRSDGQLALPCEAVDCFAFDTVQTSPVYVPNMGAVSYSGSSTSLGAVATLSCRPGYAISDISRTAVCTASGEWAWSNPALGGPTCDSQDCFIFEGLANMRVQYEGTISDGATPFYMQGATATFTCDTGYRVGTEKSITATCTQYNGWSVPAPLCTVLMCNRLTSQGESVEYVTTDGVTLPATSEYVPFNTTGRAVCAKGKDPWGNTARTAEAVPKRCIDTGGNTGAWDGVDTQCLPHICASFSAQTDAIVNYYAEAEEETRSYGTFADASCLIGFEVSPRSSAHRVCAEKGKEWQPAALPACIAVTCPSLPAIVNGGPVTYTDGGHGVRRFLSTGQYTCASGYVIAEEVSSGKMTCGPNGWQGITPVCKYYDCRTMTAGAYGSISYLDSGKGPTSLDAIAIFSCAPGFRIPANRPVSATCTPFGWSAPPPTCEDINECANLDCNELYGAGSKCVNLVGGAACTPYIASSTMTISGANKQPTPVDYPLVGPINETRRTISLLDTTGADRLTFDIMTGEGLRVWDDAVSERLRTSTIRAVEYVSSLRSFPCTLQSVTTVAAKPQYQTVVCDTSAGGGVGHPIRLQFCLTKRITAVTAEQEAADPQAAYCLWTEVRDALTGGILPHVYTISYPPPTSQPISLRSATLNQRTGTSNLVGMEGVRETVMMTGLNFFANPPGPEYMSVIFGPLDVLRGPNPHLSDRVYKCEIGESQGNRDRTSATAIFCEMEQGQGLDMHYLITVMGQSVITADSFSFPITLLVDTIRGCPLTYEQGSDYANATGNCPTFGGLDMVVTGDGFLEPTTVYVNGDECVLTSRTNMLLHCTLPVGTGTSLSLIVTSGSRYFEAPAMVSYAAPKIKSLYSADCANTNDINLINCPRLGGAVLTIEGENFGRMDATVYVGGVSCTNVTHIESDDDPNLPHTRITCVLPEGARTQRSVVIFQRYGELSTEPAYISYSQCQPGTRDTVTFTCEPCLAGTYTDNEGQVDCKQCAPGTFNSAPGMSTCSSCRPGTYSAVASSVCTDCAKGTFSTGSAGSCTTCSVGTYSAARGASTCLPCPYGGTSDPDYAGCHCLSGFYLNHLNTCVACMLGGNCTNAGTTYFTVVPLPGFFPTSIATDTDAPRVKRFTLMLASDLVVEQAYDYQVFMSSFMRALYDDTGITRERVQIISATSAAVPTPGATAGALESLRARFSVAQLSAMYNDTEQRALGMMTTQEDDDNVPRVPGIRLVVDVYPSMRPNEASVDAVYERFLELIGTATPPADDDDNATTPAVPPSSLMAHTFGSSVSRIVLDDAYTRAAFVNFEHCLSDACVGGLDMCVEGYEGPLCTVCAKGYSKKTTYLCERCGSMSSRVGEIVLSIFVAIALCGALVFLAVRDTSKNLDLPRIIRAVPFVAVFKIIVCAVQVWAITAQFDMQWPGVLGRFMTAMNMIGSVGVEAMQLDCFASNLEEYGFKESTYVRPLFLTTIGAFVLPVLALLLPLFVLIPTFLVHRRRYTKMIASVAYVTTVDSAKGIEVAPAAPEDNNDEPDALARAAAAAAEAKRRRKTGAALSSRTTMLKSTTSMYEVRAMGAFDATAAAATNKSVGDGAPLAPPGVPASAASPRVHFSGEQDSDDDDFFHSSFTVDDIHNAPPVPKNGEAPSHSRSSPNSGASGSPEAGAARASEFHVDDFDDDEDDAASAAASPRARGSVRKVRVTRMAVKTGAAAGNAAAPAAASAAESHNSHYEPSVSAAPEMSMSVAPSVSRPSRAGSRSRRQSISRAGSFRHSLVGPQLTARGLQRRVVVQTKPDLEAERAEVLAHVTMGGSVRDLHAQQQSGVDATGVEYLQLQRDRRALRHATERMRELTQTYVFIFLACVATALYLIHPNITRAFFRLVACKTVGGESAVALAAATDVNGVPASLADYDLPVGKRRFVLADMSLVCYSNEHIAWMMTLGLFLFAFWVVGVPLCFYLYLKRNSRVLRAQPNQLQPAEARQRHRVEYGFAFLFLGFQPKWYYWFLAEMGRKVLYAAISIFFPGQMHVQLLMASFVAFAAISAQTAARPFEHTELETLEFFSLLVTFVLFFLANFYFIENEITESSKDLITAAIFVALMLFFVSAAIILVVIIRKNRQTADIRTNVTAALRRAVDVAPLLQQWRKEERRKREAKSGASYNEAIRDMFSSSVEKDARADLGIYLNDYESQSAEPSRVGKPSKLRTGADSRGDGIAVAGDSSNSAEQSTSRSTGSDSSGNTVATAATAPATAKDGAAASRKDDDVPMAALASLNLQSTGDEDNASSDEDAVVAFSSGEAKTYDFVEQTLEATAKEASVRAKQRAHANKFGALDAAEASPSMSYMGAPAAGPVFTMPGGASISSAPGTPSLYHQQQQQMGGYATPSAAPMAFPPTTPMMQPMQPMQLASPSVQQPQQVAFHGAGAKQPLTAASLLAAKQQNAAGTPAAASAAGPSIFQQQQQQQQQQQAVSVHAPGAPQQPRLHLGETDDGEESDHVFFKEEEAAAESDDDKYIDDADEWQASMATQGYF